MREQRISTFLVGSLLFMITAALVAGGVLTTQRSESSGLLAVSGADLLNMGSLAQLRVSLVSSGGTVLRLLPDGALVLTRQGRVEKIIFASGTVFRYRGITVTQAAIERGAHLTVLGLRGSDGFGAVKVYISPHHHAIGGRIEARGGRIIPGKDILVTIIDRHDNTQVVRLLPGTTITLNKRPVRGELHADTHVVALAVPAPQEPGIFLADSVRVVLAPTPIRLGGFVKSVAPARNIIIIFNRTLNQTDTIEVAPGLTKITLSKWDSGYADMQPGDHLTVSGTTDPTHTYVGPNPIKAKRIRVGSPSFGGVVIGVGPAPGGAVTLAVRAHHNHILRIDAPGRAAVLYGAQPAHVLDIAVGQKIAVRGVRLGKFEMEAGSIRIYPRSRTVGGAVASILPGAYRIVSSTDGSQVIVHVTPYTSFTLNGRPATRASVKMGLHIRVYGYDALHSAQKNIPTLIARHVSVIVHQHRVRVKAHRIKTRKTKRTKHAAAHAPAPGSKPAPVLTFVPAPTATPRGT